MLTKTRSTLSAVLGLMSCSVFSAIAATDSNGWFLGVALGAGEAGLTIVDGGNKRNESSGVSGVFAGYNVSRWFGIDSQILSGRYGSDDVTIFSLNPRASFPLTPRFSLFARGGLANMAFVDQDNRDEAYSGVIPSIGFGARVDMAKKVKFNVAVDYATGELQYEEDSRLYPSEVDLEHATGSVSVYYQF